MKNLSYSLRQIASWTSNDSEVLIPALQRGLVWKPRQVELLWDSILRGFPIGSFILSDIVNNEGAGKYYLMDGQQRYNTISIGFNTVPDARAVLWIDLIPPSSKNSTRRFWVKATTTPHPWGYKNDDDANRLNTAEKRNALNVFNLRGNIYNDHFSLTETWPTEAICLFLYFVCWRLRKIVMMKIALSTRRWRISMLQISPSGSYSMRNSNSLI